MYTYSDGAEAAYLRAAHLEGPQPHGPDPAQRGTQHYIAAPTQMEPKLPISERRTSRAPSHMDLTRLSEGPNTI